jgi:N6-L-threonylcarbamoyladenine synthase
MENNINILAIESSCDETAAAVVASGSKILSSVVASQQKLHEQYGGVVPEIASRAHVETIYPVVKSALEKSKLSWEQIHAIAVANQPGLTISLIVGLTAAKTLAFMKQKPLIAVNHVHAHLQSAMLNSSSIDTPAVALIVSGGHTNLYKCKSALDLELIGKTVDDAAGEAFDKVASILNLPYPGGPSIEKTAKNGNPKAIKFPRSMLDKDNFDFSFSGLKTAVLYHCKGQNMKSANIINNFSADQIADIAASFQAAVVDVLVEKTKRAADFAIAETVLLAGGVAANTSLREKMQKMCQKNNLKLLIAPKKLCTDNAVMVASLACHKYLTGRFAPLTLEVSAVS